MDDELVSFQYLRSLDSHELLAQALYKTGELRNASNVQIAIEEQHSRTILQLMWPDICFAQTTGAWNLQTWSHERIQRERKDLGDNIVQNAYRAAMDQSPDYMVGPKTQALLWWYLIKIVDAANRQATEIQLPSELLRPLKVTSKELPVNFSDDEIPNILNIVFTIKFDLKHKYLGWLQNPDTKRMHETKKALESKSLKGDLRIKIAEYAVRTVLSEFSALLLSHTSCAFSVTRSTDPIDLYYVDKYGVPQEPLFSIHTNTSIHGEPERTIDAETFIPWLRVVVRGELPPICRFERMDPFLVPLSSPPPALELQRPIDWKLFKKTKVTMIIGCYFADFQHGACYTAPDLQDDKVDELDEATASLAFAKAFRKGAAELASRCPGLQNYRLEDGISKHTEPSLILKGWPRSGAVPLLHNEDASGFTSWVRRSLHGFVKNTDVGLCEWHSPESEHNSNFIVFGEVDGEAMALSK